MMPYGPTVQGASRTTFELGSLPPAPRLPDLVEAAPGAGDAAVEPSENVPDSRRPGQLEGNPAPTPEPNFVVTTSQHADHDGGQGAVAEDALHRHGCAS